MACLEVDCNGRGVDDSSLGQLLEQGLIRRMIALYVGGNKEFDREYLAEKLEVDLTPETPNQHPAHDADPCDPS